MAKGFFNWIKADGSTDFLPEKDRYHLYISYICPFACRALTVYKLKGLEEVISISVLDPVKKPAEGFKFNPDKPGCDADVVNGCKFLKEVYKKADPDYAGSNSVPLLWDKKKGTAVNNESIDIMRMFNKEFNAFCPTEEQRKLDFLPDDLKDEIEEINSWVHPNINFGVYKTAFSENQAQYDKNVNTLFESLDKAESLLSKRRYLVGDKVTEADIRLFTSLIRFDLVYYGLFKCNKKRMVDYPNLFGFSCDMYQMEGVKETVNLEHIRTGYWAGFPKINPTNIVPIGPSVDFSLPHNRDKM